MFYIPLQRQVWQICPTITTTYTLVQVHDNGNCSVGLVGNTTSTVLVQNVTLDIKVYLHGPWTGGSGPAMMTNMLTIPPILLSGTDPYGLTTNVLPGADTISVLQQDVIDWVWVGLRNSSSPGNPTFGHRAGSLKTDDISSIRIIIIRSHCPMPAPEFRIT